MATYIGPAFRAEALDPEDDVILPGGVVELRVHGVNGGTPEHNLDDPHPIRITGDDTAGIYRKHDNLVEGPKRTVEAYNWSSINSKKSVRAWWLLLFPFAASNLAGWLFPESISDRRKTMAGWAVRFLSLTVTLIAVVGLGVTTVDIVGVQCGGSSTCTESFWLGWLDRIVGWHMLDGQATRRATLFALVPLLALLVVWFLGRRSNKYEAYGAPTPDGPGPAGKRRIDDVRLNEVEFWQAPDAVYVQAWIHASVAMSGMATAMALAYRQLAPEGVHHEALGMLGKVAIAWMLLLGLSLLAITWMQQIPRSVLRKDYRWTEMPLLRWLPGRLLPKWSWIPGGGSMVLLGSIMWLGWFSESGEYVVPLEGFRNSLIVATLAGLIFLGLLGWATGVAHVVGGVLVIGVLWFFAIWGENTPGTPQVEFRIDVGTGVEWFLAEVVLAVIAIAVYWYGSYRRTTGRGQRPKNPLRVMFGAGLLIVLALGAVARSVDPVIAVACVAVLVVYGFAMFWIQVDNGHDLPQQGQMREGTAMMMAAIGLVTMLTAVASIGVWVARAVGTAVAYPLPHGTDVSAENLIVYPAEAGWIALAAVAGVVTFVGVFLIRMVVLHLARWAGKEDDLCLEYDCDEIPVHGYDLEDPPSTPGGSPSRVCVPAETCADGLPDDGAVDHDERQIGFARKARSARTIANLVDDADWMIASAVTVALGALVATVAARLVQRLPGGWLSISIGFATWALAFAAVGAAWAVRTARENLPLRQSFGMLWDVMAFFPRRFHPLAPPCYAERSVIDVRNRLIWLRRKEHAEVIVVAHSEGTMITAAALLSLQFEDPSRDVTPRPEQPAPSGKELEGVAWVTYGCMLGRLFGRAWPDLLRASELRQLKAKLEGHGDAEIESAAGEERFPLPRDGRLPRWVNFGRYTDYLGGRVFVPIQPKPTRFNRWPERGPERCDDIFFRDPIRRWRIKGQTEYARLWRHSFQYESDMEDPRFREHVWNVVRVFSGLADETTLAPTTCDDPTADS